MKLELSEAVERGFLKQAADLKPVPAEKEEDFKKRIMFEKSSAGEEPFENLNYENLFGEVQDALEDLIYICVILIYL